jgi:transcriptional regulator with XRE-family HTH domain
MDSIRQARLAAGLTQQMLAERLGITQGAISQWEKGTARPSISVLKPLASVLGITLDELITEESQDEQQKDVVGCGM